MLVVATERAVELIIDSKIFEPLRIKIKRWAYPDAPPEDNIWQHLRVMVDYLFNCGYCLSVWVGAIFAIFTPPVFESGVVNWLVSTLVLHGGSNIYHVVYELLRRGRVKTYDVSITLKIRDSEAATDGQEEWQVEDSEPRSDVFSVLEPKQGE